MEVYYDSISFIPYFDCFICCRTRGDYTPNSLLRHYAYKEKDEAKAAYAP
jgi:hypothetical protein